MRDQSAEVALEILAADARAGKYDRELGRLFASEVCGVRPGHCTLAASGLEEDLEA